jgi:hypothetical protein
VPKCPEQLNNYLSFVLARQLGLITPRCELVNVFCNGKNLGLYEFTEQPDEGTLQQSNRVPGVLLAGDLTSRDRFTGLTNRVFDLPQQWVEMTESNHGEPGGRAALATLLAILDGEATEAAHAALSQLLDMRAWGRFGAFELLTQTAAYDEFHNWRLFWDPLRCKLEPVVWDPVGWSPDVRPADGGPIVLDVQSSRLHQWLCRNGDWLAARQEALQDFFTRGACERFAASVQQAVAAAREALACDLDIRPTDPGRIAAAMQDLLAFQARVQRDLRLAYLERPGHVAWAPADGGAVRLQIDGHRHATEVALRFQRPPAEPPPVTLRTWRAGAVRETDLSGGAQLRDGWLVVPARLFAQRVPQLGARTTLAVQPACYELVFGDVPADNRVVEVRVARGGEVQPAEPRETLPRTDLEFVYRTNVPHPRRPAQLWRGIVDVTTTTEVAEAVVIAPGTSIRLAAGASLLFRNRVAADGTKEQPIRFQPAAEGQDPWGTVLISGAAADGSTFRWCDVRGGSGYKVPLEDCCAMFSIHGCKGVRVEDCVFAENHLHDDVIHAMYSEVVFDRATVDGARLDALDCDFSEVVIRNCGFRRSGHDGVDLVRTKALVQDCTFAGNGDKGLSIDEGSSVLALRSRFDGCSKAIECKDGSVAQLVNCDVRNCKRAVSAWRKNRRYDAGGRVTVQKSVVLGNETLPTADPWSRAALIDCQVDGEPLAEYDQEYVDGTVARLRNTASFVDHDHGPVPRGTSPLPFPAEFAALQELFGDAWQSVRSDRRGLPGGN